MGGGLQVKLIIITVNSLQFAILTFREYSFDLVGLALKAQGPLFIALGSFQANVLFFWQTVFFTSRVTLTLMYIVFVTRNTSRACVTRLPTSWPKRVQENPVMFISISRH